MISPDPDLLIPIRTPYTCFEDEEGRFLKTLKKQYVLSTTLICYSLIHSVIASFQSLSPVFILSFLSLTNRDSDELFSDSEYMISPPLSKFFQSSTADTPSQKLYHDEAVLLTDNSNAKPSTKEVGAGVESPVLTSSIQELEASVDVSFRKIAKDKMLDTSFETMSLKRSKEESCVEATSRKTSRDRSEVPINVAVIKGFSNELDPDFPARKVERETGDFMDTGSRNVYRERVDLPLDVRKKLWNELEATTDVAPRKISSDMMGISMDSGTRRIIRDDAERPFDSVSRRIKRDSMGMSLDASYRKLPRSKGECQLDSSLKGMDKMAESTIIPLRKASRDELEFFTDATSIRMLPREKFESLMDISSSTDKQEFSLEPSTSRRVLGEGLEMSAGSLRRRTARMPRDDSDSSADSHTGCIPFDRSDVPLEASEAPKRSLQREDSGASEASSSPGRTGQPDLMVTSQGSWKSSSDFFAVGPLSHLVYDGILEKSCNSVNTAPTTLSASTPDLPQGRMVAEFEAPLPPPRIIFPSTEMPCVGQKDKEKSKKSLKLKNLFKKKNESTAEKVQSGLQKL